MKHRIKQWENDSQQLARELDDFADNYKCQECDRFYCSHMLRARRKKFRQRIDRNLEETVS